MPDGADPSDALAPDPPAVAPGDVEPHLFASVVKNDPDLRENVLRLAAEHGVTLTYSYGYEELDHLDALLGEMRERDIEFMLNTGRIDGFGSAELAADADARAALTDRLLDTVGVYADHYPEGRIYLWHEAPLFENWAGDDQDEQAESIAEHGPAIFAAQKRAVREAYPDIDVGIFVHNPFMAPPSHTETPIFGRLMDRLREREALPDFTYCDMYRGYYEWEAGHEAVNDYLGAVLANAREQTGGRPVHYLGEAHTINNNYTPSKQAILGNLRAALATGVEGYGWYLRGNYRETHRRNFAPFLPNEGTIDEGQFTAFTGSRDRLLWALFCLLDAVDGYDPADTFDLWLCGRDLDFYEHRVSVRGPGGDWEFVGDASGYADGENPYAGGDRDAVCAFHALDRAALADGLDVRVESAAGGDGATLDAVYALPHLGPEAFVPETEATALVGSDDLAAVALGHAEGRWTLAAGTNTTLSVPTSAPAAPVTALSTAPDAAVLDRLDALDDGPTSASGLFDLWVYGDRIADATVSVAGEDVTDVADRPSSAADGQAVVVRGLRKAEHYDVHRGGARLDLAIETGGRVDSAYAMPHGGRHNVVDPARAAAVVAAEYDQRLGQIDQFAIGSVAWPTRPEMAVYEAEMQCVYRRLVERTDAAEMTV